MNVMLMQFVQTSLDLTTAVAKRAILRMDSCAKVLFILFNNNSLSHSMQIYVPLHWWRAHKVTRKITAYK